MLTNLTGKALLTQNTEISDSIIGLLQQMLETASEPEDSLISYYNLIEIFKEAGYDSTDTVNCLIRLINWGIVIEICNNDYPEPVYGLSEDWIEFYSNATSLIDGLAVDSGVSKHDRFPGFDIISEDLEAIKSEILASSEFLTCHKYYLNRQIDALRKELSYSETSVTVIKKAWENIYKVHTVQHIIERYMGRAHADVVEEVKEKPKQREDVKPGEFEPSEYCHFCNRRVNLDGKCKSDKFGATYHVHCYIISRPLIPTYGKARIGKHTFGRKSKHVSLSKKQSEEIRASKRNKLDELTDEYRD